MGDVVRPDLRLSLDILLEVMKDMEQVWSQYQEEGRLNLTIEGAFYLIVFMGGLQGEEVPMVDLLGINKYWDQGRAHMKPHVVVALLGWFREKLVNCTASCL